MTKYSQIYNNVTARLKEEDDAVKTLLVERKSSPLTRPGDSIDVWNKDPYYLFEPRLYRHVLLFNILADDNFRENDIFQLSINFDQLPQGIPDKARITLVIRHRNDSIYSVTREILHNGTTMIEAQAQNDKVTRVMGSIEVPLHPMWQETYANKSLYYVSAIKTGRTSPNPHHDGPHIFSSFYLWGKRIDRAASAARRYLTSHDRSVALRKRDGRDPFLRRNLIRRQCFIRSLQTANHSRAESPKHFHPVCTGLLPIRFIDTIAVL